MSAYELGFVASTETLFTPYRLTGGWPGSTEPRRWLEQYATLLEPGFLDGIRRSVPLSHAGARRHSEKNLHV